MQFDSSQSPYQQATVSAEAPRRGWFARNWLWFVPVALIGSFVICAGCCTGIFAIVIGTMKASDPYTQALAAVQADPRVQEAIGSPIEDATWFPAGEINIQNNQGDARFDFQVRGPNGTASVRTESRMIDGKWGIVELIVSIEETGERIILGQSDDDDMDDAPAWNP